MSVFKKEENEGISTPEIEVALLTYKLSLLFGFGVRFYPPHTNGLADSDQEIGQYMRGLRLWVKNPLLSFCLRKAFSRCLNRC